MLAWLTGNWSSIVGVVTAVVALVHSFQTRNQMNDHVASIKKDVATLSSDAK